MFPPLRLFLLIGLFFLALALGKFFASPRASLVEAVQSGEAETVSTISPLLLPEAEPKPEWRLPVRISAIPDIEIAARSVFAYVLPSRAVVVEQNADHVLPPASLTKLATAVLTAAHIPYGAEVFVSKTAIATEGVAGNLVVGEALSRDMLLAALLVPSSNDAATALVEYLGGAGVFSEKLHALFAELEISRTSFLNPHGLDEDGHVSTARDIGRLLERALDNETLVQFLSAEEFTIARADGSSPRKLTATNELLAQIPGIIAGKTGFTDKARGAMAVAFRPTLDPDERRLVILVVLGAEDRFAEAYALIRWIREAYVWEGIER